MKMKDKTKSKIIAWAKEHGYRYLSNSSLVKNYKINGYDLCDQIIDIEYVFDTARTRSYLTPTRFNINNKEEISSLIIPMNRVKADEENLIKYLEGEE